MPAYCDGFSKYHGMEHKKLNRGKYDNNIKVECKENVRKISIIIIISTALYQINLQLNRSVADDNT
jgi:hypothetical protein